MSIKKSMLRVAVVGATGAVGKVILSILAERKFPVGEIVPFASERSEGKKILYLGQSFFCHTLKPGCFRNIDLAFFDASDAVSKAWVPKAVQEGCLVVDSSAAFRLDKDTPLIVPEVNGYLLKNPISPRIISAPNCTVAPLVVALNPIHQKYKIKRIVLSTYQSVSGAGLLAMNELKTQTKAFLENKELEPKIFPHPIAFNCLPHIGSFKEDGYTSEEHKTIDETRKILNTPELKMTTTTVRVPTLNCHAESVNVECEKPFDIKEIKGLYASQPTIELRDDPKSNLYPSGAESTGKDPVYVGRIRSDFSIENGLNLWIVSDNLRKGAALNAVQIGEILVQKF